MSELKRRFFDLHSAAPTVIGTGSVIVGDVRSDGDCVLSGEVHGDGDLGGGLHIAVGGVWNGYIHAQEAVVAGKITGGLVVRGKLEIGYSAVIRGSVSARTIAIAKGAIVDGDLEITSGTPVQNFEEKRKDD
ncbi:MAG TPA: polymer-forming cytoskeletal protein [Steroidobacteraceae bacterium]|jgi:cytoskeletal protein CcmA (bactofilin family)|nr:polymer-forming cytoskeletal protein [Steroidobacteraceae bacterium]